MNKLIISLFLIALPYEIAIASTSAKEQTDRPLKILALGDSNGALPEGWVYQLKKIRPNDSIFSISVSGNTIGFNNLGRKSLNTLANIDGYMKKAYNNLGSIDIVVIMIGTNDCKAVFNDSLSYVPGNMKTLIGKIRLISKTHNNKPAIYIVTPPPYGTEEMLEAKYKGSPERVKWLNKELKKTAAEENAGFIDTFNVLLPVFNSLTKDGVHLIPNGQKMIALIIQENLKYYNKK